MPFFGYDFGIFSGVFFLPSNVPKVKLHHSEALVPVKVPSFDLRFEQETTWPLGAGRFGWRKGSLGERGVVFFLVSVFLVCFFFGLLGLTKNALKVFSIVSRLLEGKS